MTNPNSPLQSLSASFPNNLRRQPAIVRTSASSPKAAINSISLVEDEKIQDTLIDIHNYAAMGLMLANEKNN